MIGKTAQVFIFISFMFQVGDGR